jgi:hypothetical protein
MSNVFISYSHQDGAFADRLVGDLRLSAIPATYDKWLLRVGDSIIEKISAAVTGASSVIAILSPHSVESRWVGKELAMAMTGEINNRGVRVLPALIRDCNLPPMLADKLYADFRESYYVGLRQLLRTLDPTAYHGSDSGYRHKELIETDRRELSELLSGSQDQAFQVWFLTHGYALAALLGRLWEVSEAIAGFSLDTTTEAADFLVVNGQSFSYEMSLVRLGPTHVSDVHRDTIIQAAREVNKLVAKYKKQESEFRNAVAARLESNYGARQIAGRYPGEGRFTRRFTRRLRLDAKLLCGRRDEFERDKNQLRSDIDSLTKGRVEIVSYDRILDAVDMLLSQR